MRVRLMPGALAMAGGNKHSLVLRQRRIRLGRKFPLRANKIIRSFGSKIICFKRDVPEMTGKIKSFNIEFERVLWDGLIWVRLHCMRRHIFCHDPWAYSKVVLRRIRIAEAGVRFSLGPKVTVAKKQPQS